MTQEGWMQTRAIIATIEGPRRLSGQLLEAAGQILLESVRRHRGFVIVILAYWAACYAAAWATGGLQVVDIQFYSTVFSIFLGGAAVVAVIGTVLYVMIVERPAGSLYPAIGQALLGRVLSADRLANLFIPVVLGPLFFTTFGSFKRLIPLMNPYGWDHSLMIWDAWLHGGTQPWELLQPLIGTPMVTASINFIYNIWLFLLYATFIWQACTLKRPILRMQYLVCFLLFWIVVGTLLATVLSSAGPCYYGRITGLDDPYAPLMDYLRAANEVTPVWSVKVQEMLWDNYVSGGTLLGSGISAMPSMHLAIATLMALLGWRTNRWAGIGYTAFAAVILVGSVHLGWHYAIDGYVSIIVSIAIWHATGWALRRWYRPVNRALSAI
jgi:PAP2 superfamily